MRDALALADLRESLNVTQVQFAEQLGISHGNVSRVEGRTDVYLSTLINDGISCLTRLSNRWEDRSLERLRPEPVR
jgi:predicted transcriptional regulator